MADEGGDKRERRETSGPTINVLGTMEDVLSKLQLLNYEREYLHQNDHLPLARTAFSISTGNQATQFQSFVQLVTWLMDKCRMNIQLDWHDDTTSSCNNIYSALRDMQMPLEFPASKLHTGYGEACVLCLNFLCDRALMQNNFSFRKPDYPEEGFADEAEVDDAAEVDAWEAKNGKVDDWYKRRSVPAQPATSISSAAMAGRSIVLRPRTAAASSAPARASAGRTAAGRCGRAGSPRRRSAAPGNAGRTA